MAGDSGRRALMCAILIAGIGCISPAHAWSEESDTYPQPWPESFASPYMEESEVFDATNAESNFQALYNWRMTEKKSFSMGIMVREDPVYLNNNDSEGIAIFRYRVKF